jgi:hypothetical protein
MQTATCLLLAPEGSSRMFRSSLSTPRRFHTPVRGSLSAFCSSSAFSSGLIQSFSQGSVPVVALPLPAAP